MVIVGLPTAGHPEGLIDPGAEDIRRRRRAARVGLPDQILPIVEEAGGEAVDGLGQAPAARVLGTFLFSAWVS